MPVMAGKYRPDYGFQGFARYCGHLMADACTYRSATASDPVSDKKQDCLQQLQLSEDTIAAK